MRYDSFARLADSHIADGETIYAQRAISYGVPKPKLIDEIFQDMPHDLVIKTPKYAYQREYRVIGHSRTGARHGINQHERSWGG